ncbi:MAG: FAD/NAD(P)-binding oxidoreductase, partial [Burkholderiales bacterium PBB5]
MTAAQLLAYITVALLLQLLAGGAFALWRRQTAAGALPTVAVFDTAAAVAGPTEAWPGWRDFRVVRRSFEDAAQSQCSFHLQPVDGLPLAPFQPGQYLTFSLKLPAGAPGVPAGGRSITRCYSLSDRPDPAGYRITVKRVPAPPGQPALPPGLSSSHLHDGVHEGDVLQVKAPSGQFFIKPDADVPAVFIAGGIGITPMMSMLRWCVSEQPERPVHLYYGVRCSSDQAFKRALEDLAATHPAFRLNVVYSHPAADDLQDRDYQHRGHIDVALLRRTLPHGRHQFYVCGPPPMMQSLVPALREWGVQPNDLHFEAFGPALVKPTGPVTNEPAVAHVAAIEVRFSRSGRTLVWDGHDASLLDFAERHGLAVDSGCRSGSCGACQTPLLSGVVTYLNPPDHAVAKGHCLLCVGKPQ